MELVVIGLCDMSEVQLRRKFQSLISTIKRQQALQGTCMLYQFRRMWVKCTYRPMFNFLLKFKRNEGIIKLGFIQYRFCFQAEGEATDTDGGEWSFADNFFLTHSTEAFRINLLVRILLSLRILKCNTWRPVLRRATDSSSSVIYFTHSW